MGVVVVPTIQIQAEGVAGHIDTSDAGGDHGKAGGGVNSGAIVDGGAWRGARSSEQGGQPLEQSHRYLLSLKGCRSTGPLGGAHMFTRSHGHNLTFSLHLIPLKILPFLLFRRID